MSDEAFPGGNPDVFPAGPPVDPSLLVANLAEEPTIAGNVTRYMERMAQTAAETGKSETILREQQLPVFADVAVFLAGDAERGHVILPTGSGKTVIQAETANAIFHGTEPGQPNRPKMLVLVPNLGLVNQTIGEYDSEGNVIGGFARFAPDLSTSKYTGAVKDLSGDVVVMTYQSLQNAVKAGILPKFDVVMCDEAHRSLGEKTRAAVDAVTEDAKTIAFTATPDFDEVKSVREVYGEKIHEISLREGIELGMLSKLQIWSYKTNIKLNAPNRSGDFNMDDLEPLLRHEARNQAAVQAAANYVSQGQQGLISCIPGEKTQHATDMATLLNGTEIIDVNGNKRNIVARAVSGGMDEDELKAIYDDYREGRVDVLTFVDLLKEGFDAPNAKFLVNLRPTKSRVDAVQRLGRILRLFKPDSIAQIVEFLDDYDGAESFTAYHALGDLEAPLNNGYIYGGTDEDTERLVAGGRQNPFDMSAIAGMIESCQLEVLGELYLGPLEREQKRDIQEGRLITIMAALGRIAELGGRASDSSLLGHVGSVMVRGARYVRVEDLEEVMPRYVTQEKDLNLTAVADIITARVQEALGEHVVVRTSGIEEQMRALATQTRAFKAAGARNESIVWNHGELEQLLDTLLERFEHGAYQSLYDYYHTDDNGQPVRYNRDWFKMSQERAVRLIQESFAAMDIEQQRNALRFGVNSFNNAELIYSRALLETASNLRQLYIAGANRRR